MKIVKKYKWVILGFFILFLVLAVWIGKDILFPKEGALYGNRLEGIKDVPISADIKRAVSDLLLETEGVKKVTTNTHGKIFSVVILVDDTITIDKVKEISNTSLEKLSKEQKAFYDISFLINYSSKTDKKDFPIIGYKNKNSDVIVW